MSEMEYNKGKLIPASVDTEHFTDEDYEAYTENGFEVIGGEIYQVEWESRKEELDEIARASLNSDGTIDFETYHYNGGAHWTEVVEQALKKSEWVLPISKVNLLKAFNALKTPLTKPYALLLLKILWRFWV